MSKRKAHELVDDSLSVVLGLLAMFAVVTASHVPMKVVDEPSSFGFQPQQDFSMQHTMLKLRVQPSNFSGPVHLKALSGKCFTKIVNNYKYELCPFHNVTQHEQSLRWNPFSGVLGVWQEWEIEKYRFVAMVMREGDSCGSQFRTVKVILLCGENDEIGSVSEPTTCNYQMEFKTPLVCHPHSLLVYPTITKEQRHKWDVIETKLANDEITEKGYNKSVHLLFEEAGLMLSKKAKEKMHNTAQQQDSLPASQETQFYSLPQCTQEYDKLKKELEALKSQLELLEANNNATAKILPGVS